MSASYRRRRKAIRDAKRAAGESIIPKKHFWFLQTKWIMEQQGPCLGSLQDLADDGKLSFPNRPIKIIEDLTFGPCGDADADAHKAIRFEVQT